MESHPASLIERQIREAKLAINKLRSKLGGDEILKRLQSGYKPGKQGMSATVLYAAFMQKGYDVDLVHHDENCRNQDCPKQDRLIVGKQPRTHVEPRFKRVVGSQQGSELTLLVSVERPGKPQSPVRQLNGRQFGSSIHNTR